MDASYTLISTAAPDAHVVVTGYPRFFTAGYGDYVVAPNMAITAAEQQLINAAADLLNSTTAQVAASHGFQFVDVTGRFADHGVNAADPWISDLSGAAPFHPTADGYHAYAAALTSSISPRSLR
ncbi:GDSL-type esterase/lipase family protein [Ornithinimicrobium panacihumi]|uniref:GDSL-type esterase/lipase family protein n=1 Tax=Ornithinimicrobium panacihumi TaxID=2008449 RepID=UPI003F893D83